MKVLFCDKVKRIKQNSDKLAKLQTLRYIIIMHPDKELDSVKLEMEGRIKILTFSELKVSLGLL
ncbi:unnamed protein product [Protopolystoma xenopodis]|uniref:Uncharacterized protein n=1 Tax=Protopolystoma xenopodis TaxID=117903 RepID=A0A3S5FF68_9PLAT|nr:unnamed protein product [Protopolystoma xenopodis]